jgi:hypothetical protein
MTKQSRVNIKQLLSSISNGDILIPDFQRGFVWNKIENQQKLIASVFSRLPIGSILLLEGKHNEFSCKKIGSKLPHIVDENDETLKKFLIDGQQRITVLTNAFSDRITNQSNSEIISNKLKYRYYIRISVQNFNNLDLFGLTNLAFPFKDVKSAFFIGDRMNSIIESENANANSIFPPGFDISSAINDPQYVNKCVNDEDTECRIPLCIIVDSQSMIISKILNRVVKQRVESLIGMAQRYFEFNDKDEYNEFLSSFSSAEYSHLVSDLSSNFENARAVLQNMASIWISRVLEYFRICIDEIEFYEINVANSERARAIDIYENLNMGGVSLTTFDLLVAKVARKDINNFQKQIEELLSQNIELPNHHHLYNFVNEFDFAQINDKFDLIKSDILSKSFVDVFMNLLSIICLESINSSHEVTINDIKRETILSLESDQVICNYKKAVIGIKRAVLFMMFDLGIKKLSDIQYEHVLLNISKVLANDEYWLDSNTFSYLKYWYWVVVFSGSYDKDQSQQMVSDMNFLKRLLSNKEKLTDNYLSSKRTLIFGEHYFTKKSILLMNETDNDSYPKGVIKSLILQFILSRKPNDILTNNEGSTVVLTSYSDLSLEAHHIIPLNTATSLNESTKGLRKSKDHILNSPINFTYITSSANNKISSNNLSDYYNKLTPAMFNGHIIPTWPPEQYKKLQSSNPYEFETQVKVWLESRYDQIKGEIDILLNSIITHHMH